MEYSFIINLSYLYSPNIESLCKRALWFKNTVMYSRLYKILHPSISKINVSVFLRNARHVSGSCTCTGTENIIPRVESVRSIIFIHSLATMLDYENEGFASRARYPGSERVRGWSRVAGIRAASLCALWPRRHPTETPRVEPRAGSIATGYRL